MLMHQHSHMSFTNTGSAYRPSTLRQTQVVVIPSNQALTESFHTFHDLMEAVNAARRHARDYVTGSHLERMDGDDDDNDNDDGYQQPWSVSVNCAHLHPQFGQKTAAEELAELQAEDEAGEVDLHYQDYQQQRLAARRSPYPTIVVEVRASPPPNFGAAAKPPTSNNNNNNDDKVTAEDISKLEALFGQSAHMSHPTAHRSAREEEEDFYARIGQSITELSAVTPLQLAQTFMAQQDPTVPADAAFTTSDATEVDEAYEFVFTNFAMMAEQAAAAADNGEPRYYVVLPHFCAASATSLEKFATQCMKLTTVLPELRDRLELNTYHPEHLAPTHRAPVPVLSLQWRNDIRHCRPNEKKKKNNNDQS